MDPNTLQQTLEQNGRIGTITTLRDFLNDEALRVEVAHAGFLVAGGCVTDFLLRGVPLVHDEPLEVLLDDPAPTAVATARWRTGVFRLGLSQRETEGGARQARAYVLSDGSLIGAERRLVRRLAPFAPRLLAEIESVLCELTLSSRSRALAAIAELRVLLKDPACTFISPRGPAASSPASSSASSSPSSSSSSSSTATRTERAREALRRLYDGWRHDPVNGEPGIVTRNMLALGVDQASIDFLFDVFKEFAIEDEEPYDADGRFRTEWVEARFGKGAIAPVLVPVPMLLWCPMCCARHVDAGIFTTKHHHTHACQGCGHVWRPAIEPTVGVQFLPGFRDAVTT